MPQETHTVTVMPMPQVDRRAKTVSELQRDVDIAKHDSDLKSKRMEV